MYSGKQTFDSDYTIRDIWTYTIRYIVDSTYWSIIYVEEATGGVDSYNISQTITVDTLNTSIDLTAAGKLSSLIATKDGVTLTENIDYTVDYDLGRIIFMGDNVSEGDSIDLTYIWSRVGYIFFSTGISGDEMVYIGLRPYINTDGINGYIELKGYKAWQDGLTWSDTTFGNPKTSVIALWSSTMNYWFWVNQQRIILVIEIQSMYSSCYVGFANRLLLPHEYNYPLVVLSSEDTTINYSSTSDSRHYIADSRIISYVDWDNSWHTATGSLIIPTQISTGDQTQIYYPDTIVKVILPLYFGYLQLDNVYYAPSSIQESEDTITIGTDTYLIIEDINRHAWNQFMAIKED